MIWHPITKTNPGPGDYPVTVVLSRQDPGKGVWGELLPEEMSNELKQSVAPFFEEGETVYREDWYPPLA